MSDTSTRETAARVVAYLRPRLSGEIITPQAGDYTRARAVWNGMIDRYPLAIVRARTLDDVRAVVDAARYETLPLAIRGGGHNVAGFATVDDGIVLDMTAMHDVTVDPDRRLAVVQAGALWRDVDAATQKYGLAAPSGLISETGVAGLTLGGGIGWLRRAYGLSCDNLIAAELISAEGRPVRTSLHRDPDLLWALRGGGGNFGVVTSFTFALHPVGPDVAYALVFYDGAESAAVLRAFRAYGAHAPREIAPIAFTGVVEEGLEGVPAAVVGRSMLAVFAVYVGPPDIGEERLRPLRGLGTPLADLSRRAPYTKVQSLLDADYPRGRRYYWKSAALAELSDAAIDTVVEQAAVQPSPLSTIDVWLMGGALRDEPAGGSAYAGREAGFLINPEADWEHPEDDQANIDWVRGLLSALEPHTIGTYLNFPGLLEGGEQQLRGGFGSHFERLVEVKRRWDPDNLFRLNHNIPPG